MITPHFRQANPVTTVLDPGEVHLWRYRFGMDAAILNDESGVLSKTERNRSDRIVDPARRLRTTESRIILRFLLAGYLSVPPSEVKIRKGKLGRPALDSRRHNGGLGFNLSHSGDLMVVALAFDGSLGVDVECLQDRPDLTKLAGRVFSSAEQTAWSAAGEPDRLGAFFRGWTRKEALLKGEGAGVFRQANETEVSLADIYRPQVYQYRGSKEAAGERCLLSFQPQADAVGAVALSAGDWRVRYFAFSDDVFTVQPN